MAATILYVSLDTIPLFTNKTDKKTSLHLLWGDSVHLQEALPATGRVKVKARGYTGYVNKDHIGIMLCWNIISLM